MYSDFAAVYDRLMTDVDYNRLTQKLLKLCSDFGHKPELVLDACCGTGKLAKELCDASLEVVGIDISEEMLSIASKRLKNSDCVLLCQDLAQLDLYGTVDTVFCTLDSINHITDKRLLKKALGRISLFLQPRGMFVFDVNTVYKHQNILCNNTFIEETDDIYLIWQNELMKNNIVGINLDIFVKNGAGYNRYSESFCERAYTDEELTKLLNSCGFKILTKKDFYSFGKPENNCEKVVYVAVRL